MVLCTLHTSAQIEITATAGTTGPTSYANLRLAFAAINAGTHQGAITVAITSSPSADNNTAVLNASGSGSASYTSVLVRPTGTAGARSITCTVDAGPLIDLNGADSVTIDGRTGDGYTLILSNQSTASSANTSTIRYRADACGNTVLDCSILGRSTGGTGTLGGNVIFATGSSTGNDGNTISGCVIANDGDSVTYLISKAVMSVGSTGSLALHNSGNTITDCLVHDFFLAGGARGVLLGAGNHDWTISGNRFYQKAARTTATSNSMHGAVEVTSGSHADAGGHLIASNVIGHANASGTGIWTLSGSANRFHAIRLYNGTGGPRSTVSGNTIAGIHHYTDASGTGTTSPFAGIHVLSGLVDVIDNTIGSQTAYGNLAHTSTVGGHMHGIVNTGSTDWATHRNRIGGLHLTGPGALFGMRNTVTGTWACDSNSVGGAMPDSSMHVTGLGVSGAGIWGISTVGGTLTMQGNHVRNCMVANKEAAVSGIEVVNGALTAADNTVQGLWGGTVRGFFAQSSTSTLQGNAFFGFTGHSTHIYGRQVYGISFVGGTATVNGNTVDALHNNATSHGSAAYGLAVSAGGVVHAAHNTISGLSGVNPSGAVGINSDGSALVADTNTVHGITDTQAWAMGIRCINSSLTATGNSISGFSAPNVNGFRLERTPAVIAGSHIEHLSVTDSTATSNQVYGIWASDSALTATGNTIAGLLNTTTGITSSACGISVWNATCTIEGNTIHHVNGHGTSTSSIRSAAGIFVSNTAGMHAVSVRRNRVHAVFSGHPSNNGQVTGLYLVLRDTVNLVEGNTVHALWRATSSTSANIVRGIHLTAGTATVRNNMVHLGLDSEGANVGANHALYGIHVAGGTHAVLHNTVYIGGTVASGSNHTFALLSDVTTTRDYRNNILWNARTNASGSAKHFAVGVNSNLTGLTSDNNCLYVSGTGSVLGRQGGIDRSTLGACQSATSLDANSLSTVRGW